MKGQTDNVVSLDDHRRGTTTSGQREPTVSIRSYSGALTNTSEDDSSLVRSAGESVPVERLYGMDDAEVPRAGTVGLIRLCQEAMQTLSSALHSIDEDQLFEADLRYIELKQQLNRFSDFLDTGDGVALVIGTMLKCIYDQTLAHEAKDTLLALLHLLRALKDHPRINFERAMSEVDRFEKQVGELILPAYHQLSTLLLGESPEVAESG